MVDTNPKNSIDMIFCKCYENPHEELFKQFSKLCKLLGPITWPSLDGWYIRNPWFSEFVESISASFGYFFMKSFLVLRSYLVLVIHINSLVIDALLTLEARLKVLIWPFLTILGILRAVYFGTSLFYLFMTNLFNVCTFTCRKIFFIISSSETTINTMQIRFL